VVGAPDVNYAAIDVNGLAIFRFQIDNRAIDDLATLLDVVRDRDYAQLLPESESRRRGIVGRLCPKSILDPIQEEQGFELNWTRDHYGIISLALHPRQTGGDPAIFLAGVSGGATAGAARLLAGAT
jgi:hypothetical protein